MAENSTLTFLEGIRNNLDHIDYKLVYQGIAELKNKFVPTALIKKGWFIDRVRINKPGEIFTRIDQVSYIHDKDVLENHVDFGRANEPKQAVFYGSIISPQIEQPRVAAYLETSELFKEPNNDSNIAEIFTLSRWRILEDIQVVEMIFSEEALKVNDYNRLSLENQMQNCKHLGIADDCEKQGKLFSNEFARDDIKKDQQYMYKISAAYFNYISRKSHLKGITYPSVASMYLGQNIALLPELVDKYLKLETVGMFRFERKNGMNLPIDSFKIATDLGENAMNFKWIDYIGAENQ